MKTTIAIGIILTLLLVGCGGQTVDDVQTVETPGENTMNRIATFETNMGYFKIELFEERMPITTGNFIKLAQDGFYDGTRFHRIIGPAKAPPNGFMIQGGDPLSKDLEKQHLWGTGGSEPIKDEFVEGVSNLKGTISMANSGPNSGSSQFFINLQDNTFLDWDKQPAQSKHPVFGKVVEGMHIIKQIGNVETQGPDRPVEEVILQKVTVE